MIRLLELGTGWFLGLGGLGGGGVGCLNLSSFWFLLVEFGTPILWGEV